MLWIWRRCAAVLAILVTVLLITLLLYNSAFSPVVVLTLSNVSKVERLSGELFPLNWHLATRCTKDAVICGIDYTRENRRLLNSTSTNELKQYFYSLMTTGNSDLCHRFQRFGHAGDGGYDVCMTSPFAPKPQNCLVYSFGISSDWTFDEAMANYGCEVHSFDPSIGKRSHIHPPNITFHDIGLWGEDITDSHGWTLQKLSTIRSSLGHQSRVLDVLKVDVEAAEWPFLRNLVVVEPDQADHIRQLLLELHTPYQNPRQLKKTDLMEMIFYVTGLSRVGFVPVRSRQFNWCCARYSPIMPASVPEKCCYERFYVNRAFSDRRG